MAKVEAGFSAQRIYQDWWKKTVSPIAIKRFVRELRSARPERIWRAECQPREELQLDFGLGAHLDKGQRKRRRSWVMRLVLSYSQQGL